VAGVASAQRFRADPAATISRPSQSRAESSASIPQCARTASRASENINPIVIGNRSAAAPELSKKRIDIRQAATRW